MARYAAADNLRPQHAADGWSGADPNGRTKNRGLNEGLGCVSYGNLQVLRCHPCACKFFCISFPLNS